MKRVLMAAALSSRLPVPFTMSGAGCRGCPATDGHDVPVVCPAVPKSPSEDATSLPSHSRSLMVPDLTHHVRGYPAQPLWYVRDRALAIIKAFKGTGKQVVWMLLGEVQTVFHTVFEVGS